MEDGTSATPRHTKGTATLAVSERDACRLRDLLDRIGDKWSLLVVELLGDGTKRFTELKRDIEGISQRMLTLTLRRLERDEGVDVHARDLRHDAEQRAPQGVDGRLDDAGDRPQRGSSSHGCGCIASGRVRASGSGSGSRGRASAAASTRHASTCRTRCGRSPASGRRR